MDILDFFLFVRIRARTSQPFSRKSKKSTGGFNMTESQFIAAQPDTWSVLFQDGKFYVSHRIVAWEIHGSQIIPWHAHGQCRGHEGVWCAGLMERKGTSVEYVRYGMRLVQPGTADEQEVKPRSVGDMFREHNMRMAELASR